MFFVYGFVFMDRLSIVFLFPLIAPALHMSHTQIGLSVSILSICWAISSYVFASISDAVGNKKWMLIVVVLCFSLASVITGLAATVGMLLFARALMGVMEGPVLPLTQATVIAESRPERRGFNIGVVQSATALLGSVVTPFVVVAIAEAWGWREAFYLIALPGVVAAFILMRWMREPALQGEHLEASAHRFSLQEYGRVFQHRNTWLCMVMAIGFMSWLFAFSTFAPTYLVEADHFTPVQASWIMSVLGLGSFVWGILLPWWSDRIGRKPVMLLASALATFSPLAFAYVHSGWGGLAVLAFFLSFAQGYAPLFLSVIPGESIPRRFVATAMSAIVLVGEIFGGTMVPTLAGALSDHYSLNAPFWLAAAGSCLVFLASLGLLETAPRKLARRSNVSTLGA
ncbi:MAG: MFS transporter [Alicyclobacillus sp.]|nr:MFS transporter [Alicyclobacillus sp.]